MDHAVVWAVAGLVLVIVELVTGTFYLLMLGIAAFGAGLAAAGDMGDDDDPGSGDGGATGGSRPA